MDPITKKMDNLKIEDEDPTGPKGANSEKNRRKKERAKLKKTEEAKKKADEELLLAGTRKEEKAPNQSSSVPLENLSLSGKIFNPDSDLPLSALSDCPNSIGTIPSYLPLTPHIDKITAAGAPIEINPSTIQGNGLFAARNIKKGTEIIREAPLLVSSAMNDYFCVEAEFTAIIPEGKKNRILSMATKCKCGDEACAEPDLMRVYAASAHIAMDRAQYIYEVTSRINHDCVPNAKLHFLSSGALVVIAIQEIKDGEEITVSYSVVAGTGIERRKKLAQRFKFVCCCNACKTNRRVKQQNDTASLPTNDSGAPLFNQHSTEELETARQVGLWYQGLREHFDKLGLDMSRKICASTAHNLATKTMTYKWEDAVEECCKEWEGYLAAHNDFSMSEATLAKLAKPDKLHLRKKGFEMHQATRKRFQQLPPPRQPGEGSMSERVTDTS